MGRPKHKSSFMPGNSQASQLINISALSEMFYGHKTGMRLDRIVRSDLHEDVKELFDYVDDWMIKMREKHNLKTEDNESDT